MFLLFFSLTTASYAESDCSHLLANHDAMSVAISDLATMRYELDVRRAAGLQDGVTQALEKTYQLKETELKKLEPRLEEKIRVEIQTIQLGQILAVQRKHQESELEDASVNVEVLGDLHERKFIKSVETLSNGKFLVVGYSLGADLNNAEVFDPTSRTLLPGVYFEKIWADFGHSVLKDDTLLLTGGINADGSDLVVVAHPQTGATEVVAHLKNGRREHAQVSLPGGKVLMLGGLGKRTSLASGVEIYDPISHKIEIFAEDQALGAQPQCILLSDGTVFANNGKEVFIVDPFHKKVTSIGKLKQARKEFSQSLLADGRVLVTGGQELESDGSALTSMEVVNLKRKTISKAGHLPEPRYLHQQVTLADGRVLIGAGSEALLYDPQSKEFEGLTFRFDRPIHSLMVQPDGSVMAILNSEDRSQAAFVKISIGRK